MSYHLLCRGTEATGGPKRKLEEMFNGDKITKDIALANPKASLKEISEKLSFTTLTPELAYSTIHDHWRRAK